MKNTISKLSECKVSNRPYFLHPRPQWRNLIENMSKQARQKRTLARLVGSGGPVGLPGFYTFLPPYDKLILSMTLIKRNADVTGPAQSLESGIDSISWSRIES